MTRVYKPLTRKLLLERGYCCINDCVNCPYNKNKTMWKKTSLDKKMTILIVLWILDKLVMLGFFLLFK